MPPPLLLKRGNLGVLPPGSPFHLARPRLSSLAALDIGWNWNIEDLAPVLDFW